MISIPGQYGATCDGFSRREFLRLGGAGLVGVSLSDILRIQAQQAPGVGPAPGAPKNGWGRAKSVIIIYLQGGPSHIDIWDPKPDAPSNVRGDFKPIREWLRTNIHEKGSLYPSDDELCAQVTGKKLDPQVFLKYLDEKYSALYGV